MHFLLTSMIVTAAPYSLSTSNECKHQRLALKEIIGSVISVNLLTKIGYIHCVVVPQLKGLNMSRTHNTMSVIQQLYIPISFMLKIG